MKSVLWNLWHDDRGFIVSAELVLVATILVIGLLVGMNCLRNAIVAEFQDLAAAINSLNQSFSFSGFGAFKRFGGFGGFGGGFGFGGCGSWVPGSAFIDRFEGPFGLGPAGAFPNTDFGLGTGTWAPSGPGGPAVRTAPSCPGGVCPPAAPVCPNGVCPPAAADCVDGKCGPTAPEPMEPAQDSTPLPAPTAPASPS